jgi:hypothetical protein
MMTDNSIRIEEIILRYKNQKMTRTLRSQMYKDIAPFIKDVSEHIEEHMQFDNKSGKLNFVLKAKSPLGKTLLDILGDGAEEVS